MHLPVSADDLRSVLDAAGIKHFTDSDGDVGAFYERFRMYFILFDDTDGYPRLRVHVTMDRTYGFDERLWLLDRLDAWHRGYYVMKPYTVVAADAVRVDADEFVFFDGVGSSPDLAAVVERCETGALLLVQWLADQGDPVPIPADTTRRRPGALTGLLRRR